MTQPTTTDVHSGASPDGLPPLRDVIRDHGLRAKKSLSQNFILDLNLTRRIARAGGTISGKTVVEIGPGPGGLTRALLLEGAKRVVAIERDERCIPALEQISQRYPDQLEVHAIDALKTDWTHIITAQSRETVIAANLPYAIATQLLVNWLETEPWPPWYQQMILMFQKEVADRIVAKPETKAYGRLAVITQWRTEAHVAFNLKPEAFAPPPKVASAVVIFEPRKTPAPPCSVKTLSRVTKAAFGQRRKMLRQSLKTLLPQPENLLDAAGIGQNLRAENLSVAQFAKLAYIFEHLANQN